MPTIDKTGQQVFRLKRPSAVYLSFSISYFLNHIKLFLRNQSFVGILNSHTRKMKISRYVYSQDISNRSVAAIFAIPGCVSGILKPIRNSFEGCPLKALKNIFLTCSAS